MNIIYSGQLFPHTYPSGYIVYIRNSTIDFNFIFNSLKKTLTKQVILNHFGFPVKEFGIDFGNGEFNSYKLYAIVNGKYIGTNPIMINCIGSVAYDSLDGTFAKSGPSLGYSTFKTLFGMIMTKPSSNGFGEIYLKRFSVDIDFTETFTPSISYDWIEASGWLASHNYNERLAATTPTYLFREYGIDGNVVGSAMILGALTSCKGWTKFGTTVEVLHETATNSITNVYSRVVNTVGILLLKVDVTGKNTMSAKTVQDIGTIMPSGAYVMATGKQAILNALGFTFKLGKTLLPYATFLTAISSKVNSDEEFQIAITEGGIIKAKKINKAAYDQATQDYWKEQYEEYYNRPYDANAENPYQSEESYNAEKQESYEDYIKNAYGSMGNYFDKMLDFDSKLKAYETKKLDSGTTAEMDNLNKRIASKRAEYLETASGIYVGGQRVPATITDDGIFMGNGRIGAKVTADGIYAAGDVVDSNGNPITPSGGTVSGNVNLVIPDGASIPINGEISIAETSLTGISRLAENSTARELRENELHANKKDMLQNQVNYKDKNNAITNVDYKYKTQVIEEKDYAAQKAKAFTDLHSSSSFTTKEGVDIKAGYYANPVLANQRIYNATMLSQSNLDSDKKLYDELLPTLKEQANMEGKKIYKFKDVSVGNRVDLEGLVAKIIRNGGVE